MNYKSLITFNQISMHCNNNVLQVFPLKITQEIFGYAADNGDWIVTNFGAFAVWVTIVNYFGINELFNAHRRE